MSSPTVALQVELIAVLDEALDCDVYDAVPPGAEYPYVTLDRMDSRNSDMLNSRLDERFVYLSVWSTHPGQSEVMTIMASIDNALNNKRLNLSTGRAFGVQVIRQSTRRESDNLTFMGQVILRIFTQH